MAENVDEDVDGGDDNEVQPPSKKYKQTKLRVCSWCYWSTQCNCRSAHGHGSLRLRSGRCGPWEACDSMCIRLLCCNGSFSVLSQPRSRSFTKSKGEILWQFQRTEPATLEKLCKKQGEIPLLLSIPLFRLHSADCVANKRQYKVFCMICHYCSEKCQLGFAKKGSDAFILAGFDNLKKAREEFKIQYTCNVWHTACHHCYCGENVFCPKA